MRKKFFAERIIAWYRENKRNLPWRGSSDPYRIWLSEIILQQTRVAQGIPYYLKFIERFPNVGSLASASEEEVLRLWQGLGYYTRARNLRSCAAEVHKRYKGSFPETFDELLTLKGLGPYTAAAVASIAFNQSAAVVDGNVYRVLARVFGISEDISSPTGKKAFALLANELLFRDAPGEYNQAIMEFGALQCVPKNPDCDACVLSDKCFANRHGKQSALPVKTKKTASRRRYIYYLVFQSNGKLALRKRSGAGIWNGLYDFYDEETASSRPLSEIVRKSEILKKLKANAVVGKASPLYKHVLSHQLLFVRFIPVTISPKANVNSKNLRFQTPKQANKLPKPALVTRYLNDIGFL